MPPDFYPDHVRYIISPMIPFLVGLFRFKKMDPAYHSLIFIFGAATVAEIFRFLMLNEYYTGSNDPFFLTFIGYNFYVLTIGLLYTNLFYQWGIFEHRKWIYKWLMAALPLVWITDHFIFAGNRIHGQTIAYRLFYAFLLCLFAIQQINRLLVTERRSLLKNPSFLVCFCILFFFLPYIISEGIFLFKPKVSIEFFKGVFFFRALANPINYVIFTLAVLWIPPKKNFIQLF